MLNRQMAWVALVVGAGASCTTILSIDGDYHSADAGSLGGGDSVTSGHTASSASSSSGSPASSGTTSSVSSGGSSASSGTTSSSGGSPASSATTGGGGMGTVACTPGTAGPCAYSGPSGTQDVGTCHAATTEGTCNDMGTAFEGCTGEVDPATDVCSNDLDEDCNGSYCSQTLWAKEFGDDQRHYPTALTTDSAGDIIVAGVFNTTMDFGGPAPLLSGGGLDGFIADLDAQGGYRWARAFGGATGAAVTALTTDAIGNVYVCGAFGGTLDLSPCDRCPTTGGVLTAAPSTTPLFVAELAADDGSTVWAQQYPATYTSCSAIALHGMSLAISGTFEGDFQMGTPPLSSASPTSSDGFVAQLNATDGTAVWSDAISDGSGQSGQQGVSGLAVDSAGNVYIAGSVNGNVPFTHPTVSTGPETITIVGPSEFWAKYDSSGTNLWASQLAPTYGLPNIAVDALGKIYIQDNATTSDGALLLTAFNPDFSMAWSRSFGAGGSADLAQFTLTPDKGFAIAGWLWAPTDLGGGPIGITDPNSHLFVLKLDQDGQHVWSRGFGDPSGAQEVHGVATNAKGEIIVLGANNGTLDFGSGTTSLMATSHIYGGDVVLAKFAGE